MKHVDVKEKKYKEKITRIEPEISAVLAHLHGQSLLSQPLRTMALGALREYLDGGVRRTVPLSVFAKEKAQAYADASKVFKDDGKERTAKLYHDGWWLMEKVAGWIDANTEVIRELVEVKGRSAYDGSDMEGCEIGSNKPRCGDVRRGGVVC